LFKKILKDCAQEVRTKGGHQLDEFQKSILLKESIQRMIINESKKIIRSSPKGSLMIRERKMQRTYYQVKKKADKYYQINITKDPDMITALTAKAIAGKRIKRARANIMVLEQLKRSYQSTDTDAILAQLPDGSTLIWEHFGLLKELGYCIHNGYKLHTYQKNNYVIGKNLIITQDDNKGNCSGAIIYGIIEKQILPLFSGLMLKGRVVQ